jgi:hypothetical protein
MVSCKAGGLVKRFSISQALGRDGAGQGEVACLTCCSSYSGFSSHWRGAEKAQRYKELIEPAGSLGSAREIQVRGPGRAVEAVRSSTALCALDAAIWPTVPCAFLCPQGFEPALRETAGSRWAPEAEVITTARGFLGSSVNAGDGAESGTFPQERWIIGKTELQNLAGGAKRRFKSDYCVKAMCGIDVAMLQPACKKQDYPYAPFDGGVKVAPPLAEAKVVFVTHACGGSFSQTAASVISGLRRIGEVREEGPNI